MYEQLKIRTNEFFNRTAHTVALEIAEKLYSSSQPEKEAMLGVPKEIQIPTEDGEKTFKILLAQTYSEKDANKLWKGTRLQQIKTLLPGEIIAYRSRAGLMSFIKTSGGDNILIRKIEEVQTGERLKTATEVSKLLGLSHGKIGRLRFIEGDKLEFEQTT